MVRCRWAWRDSREPDPPLSSANVCGTRYAFSETRAVGPALATPGVAYDAPVPQYETVNLRTTSGPAQSDPVAVDTRDALERTGPVRMKEVAEAAGVSQSTVSRVLSGAVSRVPITQGTRERVLTVAREKGYRPNPLARGLRGSGTGLLGVVARQISDPCLAHLIEAIVDQASGRGYQVMLATGQSSMAEEQALQRVLETRHCDAVVMLGGLRDEGDLVRRLRRAGIPLVGLGVGSSIPEVPVVNSDNRSGALMVLRHLFGLGHRRIAFVNAGLHGDILEREAAYREFATAHGLPLDDGYVQHVENKPSGGIAALKSLVALQDPPSAVFASTDVTAIGLLKGASFAGVKVPRDLSVVGFDDIPLAEFTVPSLTTVRQAADELARLAVDTALAALDHEQREVPQLQQVAPELIVRDSTERWRRRRWSSPGGR